MLRFRPKTQPRISLSLRLLKSLLVSLPLFLAATNLAWATPESQADEARTKEELNRSARQEAEARQQRQQQKDVFTQQAKQDEKVVNDITLPEESLSFLIKDLKLEGESVSQFSWAQDMLNRYTGRKIGMQGINTIVKRLTRALIDRGYITTRVLIPEQDLSQGTLRLRLIPGKIREIRFKDPQYKGTWKNAFPTGPGDILNLRNLEQGLEQMKRIPSQDVNFELIPGPQPGDSDVVITVSQIKPWKVILSLDDSGSQATGKIQFSQTLGIDNLFNANDLFNISFNNDAERDGERKGTKGDSIYYSIPAGKTTFAFSTSYNQYHQTLAGNNQTFLSSGKSDNLEFRLTQLLDRDQTSKTHLDVSIIKAHSKSFIDDTEIEVQRKNTTALKLGLSHRKYIGKAILDVSLADKIGVPWFGAQPESSNLLPDTPTTRYNIWTLNTSYTTPVTLGKTKAQYSINLKGQYTKDCLYGSEQISIGNRYTVRGFDGEQNLTAEKGWFVQNELSLPVNTTGDEVYLGLDYGKVTGPSAGILPGRSLTGATIGFRGGKNGFQYDFFVGWPVKKPADFITASHTFGFCTIIQI